MNNKWRVTYRYLAFLWACGMIFTLHGILATYPKVVDTLRSLTELATGELWAVAVHVYVIAIVVVFPELALVASTNRSTSRERKVAIIIMASGIILLLWAAVLIVSVFFRAG